MNQERDWTSEFAQIETEANELLDALQTLRGQLERYRDLNERLEQGTESMHQLGEAVGELTRKATEVVHALGEFEIPKMRSELQAEIGKIQAGLDAHKTQLENLTARQEKSRNLILGGLALVLLFLGVLMFLP